MYAPLIQSLGSTSSPSIETGFGPTFSKFSFKRRSSVVPGMSYFFEMALSGGPVSLNSAVGLATAAFFQCFFDEACKSSFCSLTRTY